MHLIEFTRRDKARARADDAVPRLSSTCN